MRIAHNDCNLLHTAYCVNSKNNNNINVQCESGNTCTNTLQTNSEMDAALISQTPITNKVNCITDSILTSAKLKNIVCNFLSELTALDMTDNVMDSVINASAELLTVTANSVNALLPVWSNRSIAKSFKRYMRCI